MPFQVKDSHTGREFTGKTPLEAFSQAFEEEIDTDTYKLFGIGIPVVRYWLQKALDGKRVSGYRPIQFEIVKPESHQISTFSSTAGAFPKFGILKKKRLFPIVGK